MSAWAEFRQLDRGVWSIALASLVNRMGAMVQPFLLLYLNRHLHYDLVLAGQIASLFGVGSLVASPLGGFLADRYDCGRALAVALLLAGLTYMSFPAFSLPWQLAILTFTGALFAEIVRPFMLTSLSRLTEGTDSRPAYSLNYVAINLGMSIGPTLGGYLAVAHYNWLFWVDGASSLLAAAVIWGSGVRCPRPERESSHQEQSVLQLLRQLLGYLLPYFASCVVFMGFFSASAVYLVKVLGYDERSCGWLWLINTLVIVATTVHVHQFLRRFRPLPLLGVSVATFGVSYLCLYFWTGLGGLLAALLLLTLGEMLLFSNATAYLSSTVPKERMGVAMGLSSLSAGFALTVAPFIVSIAFERHWVNELWLFFAGLAFLAALAFWVQGGPLWADSPDEVT